MKLGAIFLAAALLVLGGCEKPCSGGESCRGSNGNCMSCSQGTCNSGGNCSSVVNGVACCVGSGGGGGGGSTGCGCGTQCNSNGICCPRGYYGCGNLCYSSYNAALSAGCTSFRTCCP